MDIIAEASAIARAADDEADVLEGARAYFRGHLEGDYKTVDYVLAIASQDNPVSEALMEKIGEVNKHLGPLLSILHLPMD